MMQALQVFCSCLSLCCGQTIFHISGTLKQSCSSVIVFWSGTVLSFIHSRQCCQSQRVCSGRLKFTPKKVLRLRTKVNTSILYCNKPKVPWPVPSGLRFTSCHSFVQWLIETSRTLRITCGNMI
uniref:Putative secreted protein n=1 Tax=Amblyomma parvum TaxID=251391 RepID=A0A023G0G5_AMBPA